MFDPGGVPLSSRPTQGKHGIQPDAPIRFGLGLIFPARGRWREKIHCDVPKSTGFEDEYYSFAKRNYIVE